MAKKKKTRNQKVLADSRHYSYHLESESPKESKPHDKNTAIEETIMPSLPTAAKTNVATLTYVKDDIRKIALITFFIITLQIALYFLINKI